MNRTYYIFRHGLTDAVKRKTWYWGTLYSAPILDEGKQSIERLGLYLRDNEIDYAVSSQFLRCRQTTDIVSEILRKNFVIDRRIGEYVCEFPWSFRRRIRDLVTDLESSPYEHITICTHSLVIETLIHLLTNRPFSLLRGIHSPSPGVLTIIANGKITQQDFN